MADFFEWLSALFSNWQAWASGGGFGGAVLLLLGIAEWMSWFTVRPRTKAFVVVWCFLIGASFMAWRAERARATQLSKTVNELTTNIANLNQPDLQLKVDGVATAADKAGSAIVVISVEATNKGANSSLLSPRAQVRTADGKNLHLAEVVPPMGNIHMHGMNGDPKLTWTLNPESFLPKVLANGPIVRGGNVSGWIIFAADAKPEEVRAAGTVVTFTCTDFNGKEYSSSYKQTGVPTTIYDPVRSGSMKP
jgi:hypothetical protein